jgi:RNA polymerase sigma-70 factor (ECF subfamily)
MPPPGAGREALLARARASWPALDLDQEVFARWVAERLPDTPGAADLEALHWEDLYLACGAAAGNRAAIAALEEQLVNQLRGALARVDGSPAFHDEVLQLLREKLLLSAPGAKPKLAAYSGRGPLLHWLRTVALRLALSHRRGQGRQAPAGDLRDEGDLPLVGDHPDLGYLKERHGDDLKKALGDAIRTLGARDANALRMHLLDGVSLESIGALYGVHRTTVARWLEAARQQLLAETRRCFSERLQMPLGQVDSLIAVLRSRIDLSLSRVLGRTPR